MAYYHEILYNKLWENLINLCVEIYAYYELDREVTIGNNGTNPADAANVAKEILRMLDINYKSIKTRVLHRIDEIKKEDGL